MTKDVIVNCKQKSGNVSCKQKPVTQAVSKYSRVNCNKINKVELQIDSNINYIYSGKDIMSVIGYTTSIFMRVHVMHCIKST